MATEQDHEWREKQDAINQMLKHLDEQREEMRALRRDYTNTIHALGVRWGMYSEQSFRDALRGILAEFAKVQVETVTEFDETGEVFGRPDQIELDLIVHNGALFVCEIKSAMSKSDMHIFERKARFYERKHGRKIEQLVVISPMIDYRAKRLAADLGIKMYSRAEDVALDALS